MRTSARAPASPSSRRSSSSSRRSLLCCCQSRPGRSARSGASPPVASRHARPSSAWWSSASTARTRPSPTGLLAEGRLPNFQKLARDGSYRRLVRPFRRCRPSPGHHSAPAANRRGTTSLISSSRDRRTYLPELSSARVASSDRVLRLGRFQIPLSKPDLRLLRRSKTVLDDPRRASRVEHDPASACDISARSNFAAPS